MAREGRSALSAELLPLAQNKQTPDQKKILDWDLLPFSDFFYN